MLMNCGGRSIGMVAEYFGGSPCWGKQGRFQIVVWKGLDKG